MAKKKYELSKKHKYLIEKLCEIPSADDIKHNGFYNKGILEDYRYNTEDIILSLIEALTVGTQMEEIGRDITGNARVIFDYYDGCK